MTRRRLAARRVRLDVNGDGTLCQREISATLGQDHEFSRELLEKIQANRSGESNISELHMTLPEFKQLMMSSQSAASASSTTHGRRRNHHAAVSKAQAAEHV